MKKISLTQGKFAIVDDEDFDLISQQKWHFIKGGYAVRRSGTPKQTIYMHRYINKTPNTLHTDHINGNKLDNRRKNLRTVTPAQNHHNRKKGGGRDTGYKGVSYWKSKKGAESVRGYICTGGKYIHLGHFANLKFAAIAYDVAARKMFGKYARLNFPNISLKKAEGVVKNKRIKRSTNGVKQ